MIQLQNVTKVYNADGMPVEALQGATVSVAEGEFVALVGPSGSGKSTLLTILGAMNPPTTGTVTIDGIDVYGLSLERQADFRHEYVGFVFQQLQLVPYLTALENVMLPLAVARMSRQEKVRRATAMLTRMGLAGKERRLPGQLSGGEQGRVAVARALVNDPPILLADEPTGNLDSSTGEQVLALFRELHDQGQTVVMVTHNPEAADYADRVIHIRDGQTV
ncbi:MAG: ABC transporter ATP-binding protein [Chloroflexi bacterium]|nr:ABC transporter ATP-binding protein [Chloroflexota bacterium]MBU1750566.1 ABC transporter ATP-binding protein [Chloroflexota bacterium]